MLNSPGVLRDYAPLADGERGALVGPQGEVAWLRSPRWDSPALPSAPIGGAGAYRVQPEARHVWGGHDADGTRMWRDRWTTEHGHLHCRDALALPGSPDRTVLLRQVAALDCPSTVRVRLGLRPDYGRLRVRDLRLDDGGCWRGRVGGGSFCWSGAADARVLRHDGHDELHLELTLQAGQTSDLVPALDRRGSTGTPDAATAWAVVQDGWRRRLPEAARLGHAGREVRHARAVLHGPTGSSGAMVAATTLGLPGPASAGRNHDYRHAWISDQCFVEQAVASGPDSALLHARSGSSPPACSSTAPGSRRAPGPAWPTSSWPTPPAPACTSTDAGSALRMTLRSTRHCCCPACAVCCRPTTHALAPRCTRSWPSSSRTATVTGSGRKAGRSPTPRAPSCRAAS